MQNINSENYNIIFKNWIENNEFDLVKISKVLDCSISTLSRLLSKKTKPSDEMLKQTGILMTLGYNKYKKLSNAEKEKISEKLGTVTAAGFGFAGITSTVSSLGIAGLSGAGIMSGLAGLGAIVGGGAVTGISIAAAIPIVCGFAGYGIIKGIKYVINDQKTNTDKIDTRWEIS